MPPSITISYELKPTGTNGGKLLDAKTHTFPIGVELVGSQKAYYTALKQAVAVARYQVGDELTAWRDKAEPIKDSKKATGDDDEEEDEDT